jgi:hypothetical protein
MITLAIGKKGQSGGTIIIYNSTLEHVLAAAIGKVYLMDALNNHLVIRTADLAGRIGQIMRWIDEYLGHEKLSYVTQNQWHEGVRKELLIGWINAELELWTRAGHIKVNLGKGIDIRKFDRLIGEAILKNQ